MLKDSKMVLMIYTKVIEADPFYSTMDFDSKVEYVNRICEDFEQSKFNLPWRDLESCVNDYLEASEKEYEDKLERMADSYDAEWERC